MTSPLKTSSKNRDGRITEPSIPDVRSVPKPFRKNKTRHYSGA
ncbi:hypothetical protein yruck0001_21820 [Yersinia ruckeri ATCC 29473]|uniref:Uncharacterized protein n=1 Tax=Yersinia ruckeri TaxID=29486 RepID=A0A0A8VFG3_YERRU|nr:hypothetical protein yruck0001_21820 [Yersinia ruckeri ATCC 29473]CEK26704.1 hypothetical protein CSF007_4680 [Yersinia ruckeri]